MDIDRFNMMASVDAYYALEPKYGPMDEVIKMTEF
jgi:hypothetical protein